jgi:hypothetical protein
MAELSDHRFEKTVSFAEFKSALTTKGNAQSLRRSYHALNKLRKAKRVPDRCPKEADTAWAGFQSL